MVNAHFASNTLATRISSAGVRCAVQEDLDEKTADGVDCGIVAINWDRGERPSRCTTGKHHARNQQSGFGSTSERSSIEEKAVNCGELETHGYRSCKIL